MMTTEAPIQIENRSQLSFLLTEAAELEHGIMCCYLFAAFSLKNDVAEGITDEQLRSVRRWRRSIRHIAVEEMLHLGSVCNLLTAIGGAPQLKRPNLPASPQAYGASFKLGLAPFTLATLDQFIAIEKPIQPPARRSLPSPGLRRLTDIFSSERTYDTQGRLYRGIEDGVEYLAQKYGEAGLFIGLPEAQTTARQFPHLPELHAVTDLASAKAALKVIIEQGEGASVETADSHYAKFMSIWREYHDTLTVDPAFQPCRPVLSNPYALYPSDVKQSDEVHVLEDDTAVDIANLFDGCYELLVQMLGCLFVHSEETEDHLIKLGEITEGLMVEVIDPLGSALTTLPAGPSYPDMMAGPGFRLSRGASIPVHRDAAWAVFRERMTEMVAYCQFLQANPDAPAVLRGVKEAIAKYAVLLTGA